MATCRSEACAQGVIETARLRLEPWDDAHFEHFARFMRDPDVIRFIRAAPLDPQLALEQHTRSLQEWELHGFGKRAIVETATGSWLGFVELSPVGPGKGSRDEDIEIGYFVEPARWGNGIATEAALAVLDEAFGRCALDELIGRCRVENVASARVLAKMGFKPLRLFDLGEGVVVAIHRLQRARWQGAAGIHGISAGERAPVRGAEYREAG